MESLEIFSALKIPIGKSSVVPNSDAEFKSITPISIFFTVDKKRMQPVQESLVLKQSLLIEQRFGWF